MVWEGDDVIKTGRKIIGATNPADAEIGTLRGDYGLSKQKNGFHGSDSPEAAEREIALWFEPKELMSFNEVSAPWLYEKQPPIKASSVPNVADSSSTTDTPVDSSSKSSRRRNSMAAVVVGAAIVGTAAYIAYKKKK